MCCHQTCITKKVVKEVIQKEGNLYHIEIWIFIIEWRALQMVNVKDNFLKKSSKYIRQFKANLMPLYFRVYNLWWEKNDLYGTFSIFYLKSCNINSKWIVKC